MDYRTFAALSEFLISCEWGYRDDAAAAAPIHAIVK